MVFEVRELKRELKQLIKDTQKAEKACLESVRKYMIYDNLLTKCDKLAKKLLIIMQNETIKKKKS